MCFLASIWAYFLVPETMGKTLEQMDFVFGDNAAQEEREILETRVRRGVGADHGVV